MKLDDLPSAEHAPIVLSGLTRRFGERVVLDGLNLSIPAGQFLAVVGRSGCGKSTLLRLLARLHDPTEGRILFDGDDLAAIPAARFARHGRRPAIQMVFQDPTDSLNPRYTAHDSIAEPLRLLAGLGGAALAQRVQDVAAQVGLPAELLARYPHQLSGGQKARVGIARALAPRPHVLLADEPTSALDPATTRGILDCLADINQRLGVTVVIVTHEMAVVRAICHRAAVVTQGTIAEIFPVIDGVAQANSAAGLALLEEA